MAEVFQVQAKDVIVRLGQYDTVNALQSFDWDPAFNEEYLLELGNENYAGYAIQPEITASVESNLVGGTVAVMNRLLATFDNMTDEFTGYAFDSANPNTGTITELDFQNMVQDIIVPVRTNNVFSRSELLPRAFLSSWSMSANVDGVATETYNFEGDLAEVYKSPFHDLVAIEATRQTATTCDVDPDYMPDVNGGSVSAPDHDLLALFVDNIKVPPSDITTDDNGGTGPVTLTITSGVEIPTGARLSVIAAAQTPGSFPSVYYPVDTRFLRADDISIYLVDKNDVDVAALADGAAITETWTDSDHFLRIQSIDINVDLQREALREIKYNTQNSSIYFRSATYPLTVTTDITVNETDLKTWSRIQGKPEGDYTDPFDPAEVLNIGDFETPEWQIVTVMRSGSDVQQVTAVTDARVVGRSPTVSVQGVRQATWNFTGSSIVIEGTDIP